MEEAWVSKCREVQDLLIPLIDSTDEDWKAEFSRPSVQDSVQVDRQVDM